MNQTSIFDFMYPKYKITKPIRLIEFFAGYGGQALALKYLGIEFEHWRICEWTVKSIQAYKDLHFPNGYHPYGYLEENKDEMVDYLYNLGISSNYNEPMTFEQINRLPQESLVTICENIYVTNNLVNIQQAHAKDLEIVDTDKYTYLLTYSFPCQDLSLAGKGKGMKDTSTRSGMLWEVERILTECKELGTMPEVLLMENVPQVHGVNNVDDFNKWQLRLEELGYKNYFQDLIATDYGIPQTRNRCFMVSILGDYSYTFPKPIPLKLKLKDLLEDEIDEKYYLSGSMIKYITSEDDKYKVNPNNLKINRDVAVSKTTREGNTRADSSDYICNILEDNYNLKLNKSLKETLESNNIENVNSVAYIDSYNKAIKNDGLSGTITTRVNDSNNTFILIKNATKKGYLEATVGDGIDISSRMQHHRGTVQKDKSQTLTTSCEVGTINSDLKIRKLTPRECGRLMGVRDEDIDKALSHQSDSSAYHLFGDSIVVNVLMAIFKEMM